MNDASSPVSLDEAFKLAQRHHAAGRLAQAESIYLKILQVAPDHLRSQYLLGVMASQLDRHDLAVQRFETVLQRRPNNVDALTSLSVARFEQGQLAEAEALARQAIKANNAFAAAHAALARVLLNRSRHAEAITSYRRAVALQPDSPTLLTGLLYCMAQSEHVDPMDLANMHRLFGRKFGANLHDRSQVHGNLRDPDRRLRVGFVSGDLRQHAVAYFIEPVWRELDRRQVELFAYSNLAHEDATSQRLKLLVDHWQAVFAQDDAQLAQQIRDDGIDILIDLSGHTVRNRLLAFARKPAPVQASWIGYPETTGLTAMDYHLCNVHGTPPGRFDALYVEKLVRLHAAGPFQPDTRAPEVNPLPALQRGYVTFGSLNRLSKLGASVLPVWSRVLLAVPGSRLLMANVSDAAVEDDLRQRFAAQGVAGDRLSFVPRLPLADYFSLHHDIDVMLDSFPYTGGTTIKHALWMGVPAVTLAGQRRSERGGTANMARIGLEDWSVTSTDAYVERAVRAANDLPGLAALRAGLRERITTSPLRQAANVARSVEYAWRVMWRRWCDGLPPEAFTVSLAQALGATDGAAQRGAP